MNQEDRAPRASSPAPRASSPAPRARDGKDENRLSIGACPACSTRIEERFNYCPACRYVLRPVCASCQETLDDSWAWCPLCGERTTESDLSMPTRVISGEAHDASSGDAEEFNQRGVEFYEAERYEEAIIQFRQALALDPVNSLYRCNLAVAYGESGKPAQALEEYERALTLNPMDLTVRLNLGQAFYDQGKLERARDEWKRVIDLGPESSEAADAQENLRMLDADGR